jgi:hypothetical protein
VIGEELIQSWTEGYKNREPEIFYRKRRASGEREETQHEKGTEDNIMLGRSFTSKQKLTIQIPFDMHYLEV